MRAINSYVIRITEFLFNYFSNLDFEFEWRTNTLKSQQWKAISSNDRGYDGKFFYALSTTKTVCRPSCTSRTPNPKNVLIFHTVEEAVHQGFRPCSRCKPDQFEWSGYKKALADKAKKYIEAYYEQPITLENLHEALQMSPYYIQRSFKEEIGVTPLTYLHQVRIHKSKELLEKAASSITTIGLEVGYNDSAHFSTKFKELEGMTPKEFRKQIVK